MRNRRDDELLMISKIEIAVEKLFNGFNCAQSIFYSFCDDLNIERELALKLACGFGAGMGLPNVRRAADEFDIRSQVGSGTTVGGKEEVCGAVSGGILVISAKYGKTRKDDKSSTETTYGKTRELMDRFAQMNGSYICRDIIDGCDLTTDAGQKFFKENDLLKKKCSVCVKTVVEILEDIL